MLFQRCTLRRVLRNALRREGIEARLFHCRARAFSARAPATRTHTASVYLQRAWARWLSCCWCMFGVAGSYARMALKVANYNSLQHEAQLLRQRYDNLQKKVKQTNEQLASLQVLADEVTTAYGVKKTACRFARSDRRSSAGSHACGKRWPNTITSAPPIWRRRSRNIFARAEPECSAGGAGPSTDA